MYLDEKITEEEFDGQRTEIDKEILSIQELLTELELDINMERLKNNTSLQVRKMVSECKVDEYRFLQFF